MSVSLFRDHYGSTWDVWYSHDDAQFIAVRNDDPKDTTLTANTYDEMIAAITAYKGVRS